MSAVRLVVWGGTEGATDTLLIAALRASRQGRRCQFTKFDGVHHGLARQRVNGYLRYLKEDFKDQIDFQVPVSCGQADMRRTVGEFGYMKKPYNVK